MTHILIVEDDAALGVELERQLARLGHRTTRVADGDRAMAMSFEGFDLVLLDLMLPGTYGLDVLKRIRLTSEVPVILLTARDHTADKVRGFSLGADDYVTKPFWPEELAARVEARLRRRAQLEAPPVVRAGELEIDGGARTVRVGGEAVELTRTELDVLLELVRRSGAAVARAELAERVLDRDERGAERTLDVHVSRLRKKLGDAGKHVATVWGIGYRFDPRPDER